MSWLLPRVEKQIEDLLPDDREKVMSALLAPVPASRCEPVWNSKRRGVLKFKVGRDIRVCFRMQGQWGVVVFIGDHYACGRFIDRRAGSVTGRLIPIEEFIMSIKSSQNNGGPGHRIDPPLVSETVKPAPVPVIASTDRPSDALPSFTEWMKMLPRVIDATFGSKVREVEDTCLSLTSGVTSRVDVLQAEMSRKTSTIEALAGQVEGQAENTSELFAAMTQTLGETEKKVQLLRTESLTGTDAIRNELHLLSEKLGERANRDDLEFEVHRTELRDLRAEQDRLNQSMVQVSGASRQLATASSGLISELREQVDELLVKSQEPPLLPRLVQHDERLDRQHQTLEAVVAENAHRAGQIASLDTDFGQLRKIVLSLATAIGDVDAKMNSLTVRVKPLELQLSRHEQRAIAMRLTRWFEQIRTTARASWVRVVGSTN